MLEAVQTVVDEAVAAGRLTGVSVLVAHRGTVVHEQHAGFADREAGVPVGADTVFRLASMTKPLVSATALRLAERGVLGLDDDVRPLLPTFRPRTADGAEPVVTVRHLLTHTAGLAYGFVLPGNEPYASAGVSDGIDWPGVALEENLRRISSVPLLFPPGAAWCYSIATDVLGAALAAATGEPLPALVAAHVTEPLGMRDTAFLAADPARLAVAYADAREPGGPPRRMAAADAVPLEDAGEIRYAPGRATDPSAWASGGAGMVGTARDYLRFLEAVRTGGAPLLTPASAALMTTDQVPGMSVEAAGPGIGFGCGFAVVRDPVAAGVARGRGSFGWGGVYGGTFFVDPAAEVSVVSTSNTAIAGMEGAYPEALEAAVLASLGAAGAAARDRR